MAVTAVIAVAASVSACAKAGGKAAGASGASEPIKIGAVLSLTGTYAAMGESEKNAIELEVKRINDAGGIGGRPIEVLIEDDATDDAQANAAASKLVEQEEVVAVIGATGTGGTMAMRSVLQRAGVPQISMAGGTVITDQFDPLVFQTPWSNRIVVPFVLEAIGAKVSRTAKLALLTDGGGYGKDGLGVIKEEFVSRAESAGSAGALQLVAEETFNPGDNDMSAQLTRIKKASPDVLLLWTAGKESAIIVKNARDLGLDVPVFGGSGQARLEFIQGAGDAADGFIFGTGRSLIPENWPSDSPVYGAVAEFAARYEEEFGERPDIFAGHAYDAVTIVTDALERAGADAGPDELRDAIEQTKDLPGFGGSFSFTDKDHNGLTREDLALYRVDKGEWKSEK